MAGYLGRAKPLGTPAIIQDLKEDKIQLGYIDEPNGEVLKVSIQEEDEVASIKKQIQLLKLKKELKSLQEEDVSPVNKNFLEECINTMVSLGESKTEAKKKSSKILKENPEIKTVDSFIQQVYKS